MTKGSQLQRLMLHAKIHRARVTETQLDYTGSITLDPALMRTAGIMPYEKVLVANLSNGSRAETYCIEGREGSGEVCLNGAAARLAQVGDRVIVMAFAVVADPEASSGWAPRIVHVDDDNRPVD